MLIPETRYPIAIDLSDGLSAVALQLAPRRGVPEVRASACRDAAAEAAGMSKDDCVAFVRDVLRNPSFKRRSIALLPPPDKVFTYPLRVTPGKEEPLEAAIVREAGDVLDVPLEEAVLDYVSVQPDPSGEKRAKLVLLVAIRKVDAQHYMRMVGRGGGVLESIEPAASVLMRAHGAGAPLGATLDLLCHVGRSHTIVVVATRDGIAACRDVAWGTDGLRRKLADNLELPGKQRDADFLLRKHGVQHAVSADEPADGAEPGGQPSGTVAQLLAPLVDAFTHELHSILGYVRSSTPGVAFGDGFLYGDGARVSGLDRYLARELNLQVKVMNPTEGFGLAGTSAPADPADGARYAMALGLGLRRVRWL